MPVAMTDSVELEHEQTEPSTQVLPAIPTVEEMETWNTAVLLQWIQQRSRDMLKDDDLDNFNKARVSGKVFLRSSYKLFYNDCYLSVGASVELEALVDLVKEGGEFIPRT
jgi:hypothetical protein